MVTINIPNAYQFNPERLMTWLNYGYVIASNYRVRVVLALSSHPKTPKQISREVDIGLTHVSRTLRELAEKGLVYCVNPSDVKGRVYELTEKGRKIAEVIEKDEQESDTRPSK